MVQDIRLEMPRVGTRKLYHMFRLSLKDLKSATPFPKCYLHKEEWTFDS